MNNCYGPDGDGLNLPGSDFFDCHYEGYKVTLKVDDNLEMNVIHEKPLPIREAAMFVKVSFSWVKDYFQIFPNDKCKISLWLNSNDNPNSVVISSMDPVEPECDPYRVADEIYCDNLHVYCTSKLDLISLRIVAAGEILYREVNCADLVSGEFDFELK